MVVMAVCRVEKNKNYTTMSNFHLRDKNLSNKSRGLLSTMLSLPENWDYTTRGLAAICKDGVDGITAQLKELEQRGYLVRHRIRDSNGRITDMEYVIYEEPQPVSPDTEKPDMVIPDMDEPCLGTPAQRNIDKRSTKESNTELSSIYSIPSDEFRPSVLAALDTKRKEAEYKDIERYRVMSKEHWTFQELLQNRPDLNHEKQRVFGNSYTVQWWDLPSKTIIAHLYKDGNQFIHPDYTQGRTFTVREAARIQSFPDDFVFEGARTDQFKQIGNAVPPLLANAIAKALKQQLIMLEGNTNDI
jgi:site-specific DNA-cytosine methylase